MTTDNPDKKKRTKRSSIGILAVAALLVTIVLIVSPDLFAPKEADPLDKVDAEHTYIKTIESTGADDGLRLFGYPASGSFTLPVPVDSKLSFTTLKLSGTSEIAPTATVFLTITVNGKVLYHELMTDATQKLAIDLAIPGYMTTTGSLRVQADVTGELDNNTCSYLDGSGSLIHITGASFLEAALDKPLYSVRDFVNGLPKKVYVASLNEKTEDWYAAAQSLGVSLTQKGKQVIFTDDASSKTDIVLGAVPALEKAGWEPATADSDGLQMGELNNRAAIALTEPTQEIGPYFQSSALSTAGGTHVDVEQVELARVVGDSVRLTDLGFSNSTVQFTEAKTWYFSYSISDLPESRYPGKLVTSVTLGAVADTDDAFLLNVEGNGKFLGSRQLIPGSTKEQVFDLPEEYKATRGTITMTVERRTGTGTCKSVITPTDVQIDSSTRLVMNDDYVPTNELRTAPALFADGVDTLITQEALDNFCKALNATVMPMSELVPIGNTSPVTIYNINNELPTSSPFIVISESLSTGKGTLHLKDGRLLAPTVEGEKLNVTVDGDLLVINSIADFRPKEIPALKGLAFTYSGELLLTHTPIFGAEDSVLLTDAGSATPTDDTARAEPFTTRSGPW